MHRSFGRYISSLIDYKNIGNLMAYSFSSGFSSFKRLSSTVDLNKEIIEFHPKYSFPFIYIYNFGKFNQKKINSIHYSSPRAVNELLINIVSLPKVKKYHLFPHNSLENLKNDIFLQILCMSDVSFLFYQNDFFNLRTPKYNFYSNLFWGELPSKYIDIENESILLTVFLFHLLHRLTFSEMNLLEIIVNKLMNIDEEFLLIQDFNFFIDTFLQKISLDIVNLDLSLIQGLVNHNIDVNSLSDLISNDIGNYLKTKFSDFINIRISDINLLFSLNYLNFARGLLLIDTISHIYQNKSTFFKSEVLLKNIYSFEKDHYQKFRDLYTIEAMFPYFLINYVYKYQPFKFINMVQFIIRDYVEDYFKEDIIAEFYREFDVSAQLVSIENNLKKTELLNYLGTDQFKTTVVSILKDDAVFNFSYNYFTIRLLDEFVSYLENETKFVENILERTHQILRQKGLIDPYSDWMKNYIFVPLYLKSYFRNSILSGDVTKKNVRHYLFRPSRNYIKTLINTTSSSEIKNLINISDMDYHIQDLKQRSTDWAVEFLKSYNKSFLTKELIVDNLSFYLDDSFVFVLPGKDNTFFSSESVPIFWNFNGMSSYNLKLELHQLVDNRFRKCIEIAQLPVNYVNERNEREVYYWNINGHPAGNNYYICARIFDGVNERLFYSQKFEIIHSAIGSSKLIVLLTPAEDKLISSVFLDSFSFSYSAGLNIRWINTQNIPIEISISCVDKVDLAEKEKIIDKKEYTKTECSYLWKPKSSLRKNSYRLYFEVSAFVNEYRVFYSLYSEPFRIE